MKEDGTEEEFIGLERETVHELSQLIAILRWNTIFTFLGAVAGWIAMAVVLVWLLN